MSWELAGNAGTTAADFLGTTDQQPLVIKTGGTEAMRVNANRFVGIGTSAPGAMLEIAAEEGPFVKGQPPPPSVPQLVVTRTVVGPVGRRPLRRVFTEFIVKGGKVGIGTDTPTATLTVAGLIQTTQGGIEFPDGTVQTTATLQGPPGQTGATGATGARGVPGPPGPSAPGKSFVICIDKPIASVCECGPGADSISWATGPCSVTSDTGSCSGTSSCCVCRPR